MKSVARFSEIRIVGALNFKTAYGYPFYDPYMRPVLDEPEELRRLHHDVGLSPMQIAMRLGVQKATVYAALPRHGIERLAPNKHRRRPPLYEIADKAIKRA